MGGFCWEGGALVLRADTGKNCISQPPLFYSSFYKVFMRGRWIFFIDALCFVLDQVNCTYSFGMIYF